MLLSVIIPAFNEEKIIAHTLSNIDNVLNHTIKDKSSWEIIVCDNNSTDQTAVIAKNTGAIVVYESVNQISRARNKGAETAKGEWFLFIDADTYPDENLMNEVISLIKSKDYIGCGTTIEVKEGSLFNKLRLERMNPIYRLFNIAGGAFILCERTAFNNVHGFSSSLYAYEEIDFIIRLRIYGKKTKKKFTVLYKNPVITLGRKGEYTIKSMGSLIISSFFAPLLFILNYLLPKELIKLIGNKLLSYWYTVRK